MNLSRRYIPYRPFSRTIPRHSITSRSFPTPQRANYHASLPKCQAPEESPFRIHKAPGAYKGPIERRFPAREQFTNRHIGPNDTETQQMLNQLDPPARSMDEFVRSVVPEDILSTQELSFEFNHDMPVTESAQDARLRQLASKNENTVSNVGGGYWPTLTPEVIKRNVLESPAWYTSYTPYQPEISQGRLESLLNFQTMVTDLTGLPVANASVLDESTAAAEAMTLSLSAMPLSKQKRPGKKFLVSHRCYTQTINVLHSRAKGFGIEIEQINFKSQEGIQRIEEVGDDLVGVMVQYPDRFGLIEDFSALAKLVKEKGSTLSVGADLMALTLLKPPGELGADIAFGNAQRFGVPLGYGGPHAAFFATSDKLKRKIPGRLVGLSKDRLGDKAIRLALQTREQHIRREKATSNICTSQALLANMSAFYAIYHGPEGLKKIATHIANCLEVFTRVLVAAGFTIAGGSNKDRIRFDTVLVTGHRGKPFNPNEIDRIVKGAQELGNEIQFRGRGICVSFDETTTSLHIIRILQSFLQEGRETVIRHFNHHFDSMQGTDPNFAALQRSSPYLTHPIFNSHHSETELLRYIHHLQSKDLSLVHSMIPLGSCTMKLNATTEMACLSIDQIVNIHPYTKLPQKGYDILIAELRKFLGKITGLPSVSLQPNSGAQGEFTGLRIIRQYHASRGQDHRKICLIPVSAHGTNPASAAMAGMQVVPIKCETKTGNLDMEDLRSKCQQHSENLGAIMVTYPSTFGVFEPKIKEVCQIVHEHGGLVYMDGANMNAQIGLCSPGGIGADICHLNLHKTFCIPHGGGGPGSGPICMTRELETFRPAQPLRWTAESQRVAPVSSAEYGSASILPISWAYITMMGAKGLTHASKMAILNANYILARLKPHYSILYTNSDGRCAHEFILDVRPFKESAGVEAIDIAKRLQDYGFHAPTMSWPVPNTLMIEPTESESLEELDRFCNALIQIREEVKEVENGSQPRDGNVLKMAPHSMKDVTQDQWERPYTRSVAAWPLPYLKEKKFWPSVTRLDDTYGDMNLFCTCPPMEDA